MMGPNVNTMDVIHHVVSALWLLAADEANVIRLVERHGLPLLVGVVKLADAEYVVAFFMHAHTLQLASSCS